MNARRRLQTGNDRCKSVIAFADRAAPPTRTTLMSVDADTVRRVAGLARIRIEDNDIDALAGELNQILHFVEQLNEIDVDGVEPMTSVIPMAIKTRTDEVSAGGIAEDVTGNAPQTEDNYFLVPKVVE